MSWQVQQSGMKLAVAVKTLETVSSTYPLRITVIMQRLNGAVENILITKSLTGSLTAIGESYDTYDVGYGKIIDVILSQQSLGPFFNENPSPVVTACVWVGLVTYSGATPVLADFIMQSHVPTIGHVSAKSPSTWFKDFQLNLNAILSGVSSYVFTPPLTAGGFDTVVLDPIMVSATFTTAAAPVNQRFFITYNLFGGVNFSLRTQRVSLISSGLTNSVLLAKGLQKQTFVSGTSTNVIHDSLPEIENKIQSFTFSVGNASAGDLLTALFVIFKGRFSETFPDYSFNL